jgi:[protein-PII] uridylyltransferase
VIRRRSSRRRRGAAVLSEVERVRVDERRADACALLGTGAAGRFRIADAPVAYVLAHASSDLARHAELLDPLPTAGSVRVSATPTRVAGHWHLDVATRDQPGLLAAFSGVLEARDIDVTQAVLATWPDGAALQAFTVRGSRLPDFTVLQHELTASLASSLACHPVANASVTFDSETSALYTGCEVVAADRPGLLHSIAVTIAAVGVDIHAAGVTTRDGVAYDRFDLSDARGEKLDRALEQRIVAQLQTGTHPLTLPAVR